MEPRKGSIFPVLTKRPNWQWTDFQPCWASQVSEIWAANIYQTLPATWVREYQTGIPSTCSSNHSWSWMEVGRPSVFHFKMTDGVERAQCTHVTWGVLGFSRADGIVPPKTETSLWFRLTTWFSCWRSSCDTHQQRASSAVVVATLQEPAGGCQLLWKTTFIAWLLHLHSDKQLAAEINSEEKNTISTDYGLGIKTGL